jgi:amino acid adenylation domain-containing protein
MRKSLFEALRLTAERDPEKTALVHNKSTYSYRELMVDIHRLAAQLQRLGVQRGDRVVVCCGNQPETVVAFWGVLAAGGIVSVISPEQDVAKIQFILEDSQAAAFIVADGVYRRMEPFLIAAEFLRGIVVVGSSSGNQRGVLLVEFPGNAGAEEFVPSKTISEDLASLIYTSGSTGEPKGVMMTHANMLCAVASLNEYLCNQEDDVFIVVLPLSFDYGLYQMIMAFSVGATLVLESDMLLPLHTMKAIERYRCTVVPGVPVFFELLEQFSRFGPFDFSRVRCVTNTGAALLPRHIATIKRLFLAADIYSMYGLTECKRCTYLPPWLIDLKPSSVGIAIPNTEILVVDDQDRPCPPYQIGQLLVRGGTVMQGYWNRPEETANKIRQHPVAGGRSLYTGDYGYLDEDGCFYFKGRMDEVIKVRGRKLIPREIEDALRALDGVREAAVLCRALVDGDYRITAFVESRGCALEDAQLYAGCRARLENFQLPHRFVVLERLPRNENGKIDKPLLKSQYLECVDGTPTAESGVADVLRSVSIAD